MQANFPKVTQRAKIIGHKVCESVIFTWLCSCSSQGLSFCLCPLCLPSNFLVKVLPTCAKPETVPRTNSVCRPQKMHNAHQAPARVSLFTSLKGSGIQMQLCYNVCRIAPRRWPHHQYFYTLITKRFWFNCANTNIFILNKMHLFSEMSSVRLTSSLWTAKTLWHRSRTKCLSKANAVTPAFKASGECLMALMKPRILEAKQHGRFNSPASIDILPTIRSIYLHSNDKRFGSLKILFWTNHFSPEDTSPRRRVHKNEGKEEAMSAGGEPLPRGERGVKSLMTVTAFAPRSS